MSVTSQCIKCSLTRGMEARSCLVVHLCRRRVKCHEFTADGASLGCVSFLLDAGRANLAVQRPADRGVLVRP